MIKLIFIYFTCFFVFRLLIKVNALNEISHRFVSNENQDVYLLISTSSKLYCMKMPELNQYRQHNYYRLNPSYYDELKNYEVIYEEKSHHNSWITDAFYVKSENLIYLNVYNSSSASSDILTLKYDRLTNTWIKKILYKDQSHCLGISYNEERKELYWTAGKSIVSGSSIETKNNNYKVLYNLDLAKKLLYLKYDYETDSLYVSTLNHVYACELKLNDCKIIARDLVSARGLYLDSKNRNLYIADHKKKIIKRIKLNKHENNYANRNSIYDPTTDSNIQTIISQEILPDIGDVFYMSIYNNSNASMLIWSEFSGKIKIASLNDVSVNRIIFSTNEYTYSVNVMDNSTFIDLNKNNLDKSITNIPLNIMLSNLLTNQESTFIPVSSKTAPISTTTSTTKKTTSTSITAINSRSTSNTIASFSKATLTSEVALEIDSNFYKKSDLGEKLILKRNDSEFLINPKMSLNSTQDGDKFIFKLNDDNEINLKFSNSKSNRQNTENYKNNFNSSNERFNDINLKLKINNQKVINKSYEFKQNLDQHLNNTNESLNFENNIVITSFYQVQNLKSLSSKNKNQTSQRNSAVPPSSKLSIALVIVICLLCLSLVLNIILIYMTKMKHIIRDNENKFIITQEIKKTTNSKISSQKNGLNETEDLVECNLNLNNPNLNNFDK